MSGGGIIFSSKMTRTERQETREAPKNNSQTEDSSRILQRALSAPHGLAVPHPRDLRDREVKRTSRSRSAASARGLCVTFPRSFGVDGPLQDLHLVVVHEVLFLQLLQPLVVHRLRTRAEPRETSTRGEEPSPGACPLAAMYKSRCDKSEYLATPTRGATGLPPARLWPRSRLPVRCRNTRYLEGSERGEGETSPS